MLNGKLTRIRPLEIDDLDTLYEWYNDHDFSYWISGNWPLATLLRREDLESKLFEEDANRYAITDLQGSLIGTIGFDQVNIPARSARIYIGIGLQDYWGKGYGTDALTAFIRYLFGQWNFRRLTAETWVNNTRALSCYEKLGFIAEGRLREAYYVEGQYFDAIILGLLKKDYAEVVRL
ncbi:MULTISPECIES: GNAT family N-acetyltransferase [Dehalobacter]|uniref:GNAT family N-acetyltransferase n=1 Tax=Dehalobacter restrictus TaxID=55583 RepID=A0A857DGN4_9FIRM|nr:MULTISPECIES: GNAT family protein [Dehalobacter]MCG1026178.1 GNAT family N-acetyltransferase [Dehalobacter sp.]QHA00470.1 GNAT family N-acetyltransferase [Dehalobacter restrictus]